jgi:hypothetical protein
MSSNDTTFESISTAFKDGVYTTLLDSGVAPGLAYDLSRDADGLLEVDEYGDAIATDEGVLV